MENDDEQFARECFFFFGYLPLRPAELREIAFLPKILFVVRVVLGAARGSGGGGGIGVEVGVDWAFDALYWGNSIET